MRQNHSPTTKQAIVDVPADWTIIEPPHGVGLVAVDAESSDAVTPNLVVTIVPAPGPATTSTVDGYLEDLLVELDASLEDFTVIDVSVSTDSEGPPSQRVIAHHRCEQSTVEMLQQHTWFEDSIVVSTVSVSEGIDHALADLILDCLDDVSLADD